jgi:hypothetical protein
MREPLELTIENDIGVLAEPIVAADPDGVQRGEGS